MVRFPTFSFGGTDKGIMDKLTAMEHHFVSRAQFDLFKRAAEDLARRYICMDSIGSETDIAFFI